MALSRLVGTTWRFRAKHRNQTPTAYNSAKLAYTVLPAVARNVAGNWPPSDFGKAELDAMNGMGRAWRIGQAISLPTLWLLLVSGCAYRYSTYSRCTTAMVCSELDSIPGTFVLRVGGGGGRTRSGYFAPAKIPDSLLSKYERSYRIGRGDSAPARDRHLRDSLRAEGVRFLGASNTTFGRGFRLSRLQLVDTSVAVIDTVYWDSCCRMAGVCVLLRVKKEGVALLQTRRSARRHVVRVEVGTDSVHAEGYCRRRYRHSLCPFWFLN